MTQTKRVQLDNFIAALRNLMSDNDGYSPLTIAVKEGYIEAVNDLVDLGSDVN
jgi:ankyrin repeat protein